MRRLFLCTTYYQLIVSIHLRLTKFHNDTVDVWLSNHSTNAETVGNRLKELKVFDSYQFIMTNHNKLRPSEILKLVKNNQKIFTQFNVCFYDEIIFFNLEPILFSIKKYYKKNKFNFILSRMEEGIFSYKTGFPSGKYVKILRLVDKLKGERDIVDTIKNYYCFFPDLMDRKYEMIVNKIPPITKKLNELKNILNYIFDYKPEKITEKYIFFSSSSDIECNTFGEIQIVLNIANKVGKKNLLVKMHPRDTKEIYKNYGINVLKSSYIPWEVIQLNWIEQDKVLLTVNSCAFINISSLLNQDINGYFFLNEVKNKSDAFLKRQREIEDILNKLHSMELIKNIRNTTVDNLST